jgi:dipeptidyl aminopeptidase/acylaminoacyl peptidase
MSDVRTILERGVGGAAPPPDGFERMLRRRDRKRRNRRVAAAAVGLAIGIGGLALGSAVLRSERAPVPVDWPTPPHTAHPILREGEVVERSFDRQSLMVALDTATGDERPLVRCRSDCGALGDFAASADGAWVAYDVSCGGCNPATPEAGFWVAGADGPPRHVGDPDLDPDLWSWSPTAQQLAYVEVDPSGSELFLLDPSTDVSTRIAATDTSITGLAWGPDGRSIAYAAEPGDGQYGASVSADPTGLFVIRSGGEPEHVSGQLGVGDTAWSPDGTKLALELRAGDRSPLAVVAIDGSGGWVLDVGPGVGGPTPMVWSPDGDRIAYTRGPTDPGKDDLELWTIGADGSGRVRLGNYGSYTGNYGAGPVWSPDSDRVAFSKDSIAWMTAHADGTGTPEPIDRLEVERWQL